jgi:predicted phosphoadenosine phosphosulfate sulfurtransferase
MRVDEPFGEEARRSLWLYQIIEPDTWAKFVSRMAGVNSGALYCKDKGSILGNYKATLPEGHTWQSFTNLILKSMPPKLADHYKNKIAVYLKWYMDRGYETGIPDEADTNLENKNKVPSWRKICKCVLRNDYWCRSLGFGITKSSNYQKYLDLMKRRRAEWGIY